MEEGSVMSAYRAMPTDLWEWVAERPNHLRAYADPGRRQPETHLNGSMIKRNTPRRAKRGIQGIIQQYVASYKASPSCDTPLPRTDARRDLIVSPTCTARQTQLLIR